MEFLNKTAKGAAAIQEIASLVADVERRIEK